MKASRYNRIFQAEDGTWLAFNAWSTALAEIERDDLPFIRAILADPEGAECDTPHKREIREALVEGHFLVEDADDELAALKVDMLRDQFRSDRLFLTIAPTLDCNFRCDYCYEDHLRVTMSRKVQQALLEWTAEKARGIEEMHVTWFGGEPSLPAAVRVIENLSAEFLALSRERGFRYGGQLVTNGYLLERSLVEKLVPLGIGQIQVTVDGPPELHDRRRVLAGGQGSFLRILENLRASADLASFQLRINVDRRNAASALEVVEILQREGLSGKVRPYLAQVTFDGVACGNIQEACYSSEEFARVEVELYREALRRNLPLSRYPFRIPGAFCTADRANGYVVSPSGAVFKCWHEVTVSADRAVGHLLDGKQPFHEINEARWLAWTPMEKSECRACGVLPLCHGGCPDEALRRSHLPHGACDHYRFHLEEILDIQHLRGPASAEGGAPPRGGTAGRES